MPNVPFAMGSLKWLLRAPPPEYVPLVAYFCASILRSASAAVMMEMRS